MLTRPTREVLAQWGCAHREEPLYGPDGSAAYDDAIRRDSSEIREIMAVARATDGAVLELACGSGRITAPLLTLRRAVTAVDTSDRMLELLRERAGRFSSSLEVVRDDMTSFDRPAAFGLIVLGATSITLLDEAARQRLFARVRGNLRSGGVFVVTVATDYPVAAAHDAVTLDADRFLSAEVDTVARIRDVNLVVRGRDQAVVYSSRVHLLTAPDLIVELESAGFAVSNTPVGESASVATAVTALVATC